MKTYSFYKYQGTGNDFVILDNRANVFDNSDLKLVQQICDRKFGIGADGLILIENHDTLDFDLVYFNSDGSKSFCGNGSRCGVAFAKKLGIINDETTFNAIDGVHYAMIKGDQVHLKMNDVNGVEFIDDDYFLNTGSPHYNKYVDHIHEVNIIDEAHQIRYNNRFKAEGTNINFIEKTDQGVAIRTYERGVEDETLSCGTGATAVALTSSSKFQLESPINVKVQGGELTISFDKINDQKFENIWLIGEAKLVFSGTITV